MEKRRPIYFKSKLNNNIITLVNSKYKNIYVNLIKKAFITKIEIIIFFRRNKKVIAISHL